MGLLWVVGCYLPNARMMWNMSFPWWVSIDASVFSSRVKLCFLGLKSSMSSCSWWGPGSTWCYQQGSTIRNESEWVKNLWTSLGLSLLWFLRSKIILSIHEMDLLFSVRIDIDVLKYHCKCDTSWVAHLFQYIASARPLWSNLLFEAETATSKPKWRSSSQTEWHIKPNQNLL
jgi:hypothetical protein